GAWFGREPRGGFGSRSRCCARTRTYACLTSFASLLAVRHSAWSWSTRRLSTREQSRRVAPRRTSCSAFHNFRLQGRVTGSARRSGARPRPNTAAHLPLWWAGAICVLCARRPRPCDC
ncbi:uncharacterized protein TRAVEDRAFT_55115, partial [Trametes versicolor FP-101664 SS1]|uniref:uncharacterized protein n=1 Tax=Trametes versicolor (strain FP-101664) TaxID=717944 RepID=UPI0004622C54